MKALKGNEIGSMLRPGYQGLSLLIPLLTVTACGRGIEDHQVRQYREDGVTVVVNTGGPRYQEDIFGYEMAAMLFQDETRPVSLVYPRAPRRWDEPGFLMDGSGRFYVQDRGNGRIAVFDPDGRFERSIGRSGRAPGEFVFLHLYGLVDDTLEIYDESLHRFTFYRTDGTLVETLSCPVGGGRVFFDRTRETFTARDFPQEQVESITMLGSGFRTFDRTGTPIGQARSASIPMYYAYFWSGHKGGEGDQDLPFTGYPAMAWTPDGIYLIDGLNPVIGHFALDGTPLRRITLDLPEMPVTGTDRQRIILDLEARTADSAGDEYDLLQAIRETLTFPDKKSHWCGIQVDDAGYLWLEVPDWDRALDGYGEGRLYQVVSPAGEFLGTTRAPAAGKIMRGHFLGIRIDPETGREDYIAWRLVPRAEGLQYP